MDCPACGAPAQAGDHFCRRCGGALAGGDPPPPSPDLPSGFPSDFPTDFPSDVPLASARPARRLSGSALALLATALVLFLAATNPSPAAYVAWAAPRLVPAATFVPVRGAAYVAVERATVAESYGVCTVFRTSLTSGTMTVLGILGQFLPIAGSPAPGSGIPPATRPRRRGGTSVQI